VWVAAVLICLGAMAGQARADGDPASDVLATQTVFLPQDGALPAAQQSQLIALVGDATRAGFPVRVALIATRSDLGSVTALWHQPAAYARFLGEELTQVFRGTLLVVMPNGFGVARVRAQSAGSGGPGSSAALDGLPAPGAGGSLGAAAVSAVQRLAAGAGHRLVPPGGVPAGVAIAHSSTDIGAWLAFAVGAILIAVAWAISLRLRPPRRRDGVASPHGS
jgi:hypothetical protein